MGKPRPGGASPAARAWQRFARNRLAIFSAVFLGVTLFLVLAGPWLSPYPPQAFVGGQFEPPGLRHWCGTDGHGRDLLTRILDGGRLSLLAGAMGAAVSLVIGVLWGGIAGYAGGRWDALLMRTVDVLYSLPTLVLVIVLVTGLNAVLDRGEWGVGAATVRFAGLMIGLGAVSWLTMARIVRGEVLSLRTRPFVEASRALGASHGRILFRHILPNVTGVIIVYLALNIPAVMLYESFLSFLGLGVQPPQASLGSLLAEGASQINPIRIYWWIIAFPAGALAGVLLALNLLGDGLRDALDPHAD
ncbi:MAG: ABC transporter permease [Limisphaerales bacterium]